MRRFRQSDGRSSNATCIKIQFKFYLSDIHVQVHVRVRVISLFFLQEAKPTGRADGPDNFLEQVPGLDTSRSGVRAAGWSAPGCHHLSRVRTGQPSIRESR